MTKRKVIIGGLFLFLIMVCVCFPAFAQTEEGGKDVGVLVAKIIMGFSLSIGLAGSAIGLGIAFSALLGGGQENFFKNIAVALMPSTQGIYSIVVLFANMGGFETDSYATAGKAAAFGFTMFFSAWYQGVVCAAGIRSIFEGRNTLANAMVSGAMPETYAVFALVMTFIMK
jgi:F0F1-type ATP synthase membrane subunit c/vacuolar-type H+-ATPase subunit K